MDAGGLVLPQRLFAPELAPAFVARLGPSGGVGCRFRFMNLVLEMLHECLGADKIPLAVAAPELAGMRGRLEVLRQSGAVGEELPTLAAVTVVIGLFELIHDLATAGTSLCFPRRRPVAVAIVVSKASQRTERAAALPAAVAMLGCFVLLQRLTVREFATTA